MKLKLPRNVGYIINTLYQEGYEGYAVGGCIRDCLLKKKPNDWDICTSAEPEKVINIFREKGFKAIPTGLKHGTITLILDDESYEITTFRIESEYEGNRRPISVIFTDDIVQDLSRRDFTINAMAYNNKRGLIDPFHGRSDLNNKIVKTVGNANERFQEDALRIIRGVRFACQLNFEIDDITLKAMKTNRDLISNISMERIREELNKILLSDRPSSGFYHIKELSLLPYIIPELELCIGFDQKNPYHHKDVYDHIMEVLDKTEKDLVIRLGALLHDIGKPQCFTIDDQGQGHFYKHSSISTDITELALKRLKYDNNTIKSVKILVKEHMSKYDELSDKAIKRFINRVGLENMSNLFALQRADILGSKPPYDLSNVEYMENRCKEIVSKKEPLSLKDLHINGYELMSLGIKPGKKIGEILEFLLGVVLESPESNTKEVLIELVRRHYL